MKTTTFKSLLVKLAIILVVAPVSAQDLVGIRIDLKSANYTDKLWFFSVATSTRNFDAGWDGYKGVSSSSALQFFAWESDGNYQIDVVPDLNNTYIGFKPGSDSVYTLTFSPQNIALGYQQLYLIDSVANNFINICVDGAKYTFTAQHTSAAIKRFKIVTSLPQLAPAAFTGSIVSGLHDVAKDQNKKIKIYSSNKTIFVENIDSQNGKLNIYNASSGTLVKNSDFNGNEKTTIETDLPKGVYVLKGKTLTEELCTKVVIN
jgi:hypothetical protein